MPRTDVINAVSRRDFVKAGLFAGITIMTAPGVARSYQRNEKLRMACIGAGGRAGAGIGPALGEQLVAIAEVDPEGRGKNNIERVLKASPDTKIYTDYRKLFDTHRELDAVWVGTPDHTHFGASILAMQAGAGVYCEKPLTYAVNEARILREVANDKKLPTQMGNQGHSSESIRVICEHLQAGSLGELQEVMCISNRRFSANDRPASKSAPAGMDWEAWIGPASYREYHDGLHPFSWRGWLEYGAGSLGDMGCHTMDGAVWGLKLTEADSFEVECLAGKPTKEGFPPEAEIVWRFPARGDLPPVALTWIHGRKPDRPDWLPAEAPLLGEGTYYVGDKGVMTSGSHCQNVQLWPEKFAKQTPQPAKTIERSPHGHTGDFLAACRDRSGQAPSGNFDYSARLTEIVLLGNIACLVGEKLTYDMREGRVTNNDKANALLVRKPRKGWETGYKA